MRKELRWGKQYSHQGRTQGEGPGNWDQRKCKNKRGLLPGYRPWGTVSFGSCLRFDLAWVEMELTQGSKPSPGVGLGGQPPSEEPQKLRRGCGWFKPVWLDGVTGGRMPAFWKGSESTWARGIKAGKSLRHQIAPKESPATKGIEGRRGKVWVWMT